MAEYSTTPYAPQKTSGGRHTTSTVNKAKAISTQGVAKGQLLGRQELMIKTSKNNTSSMFLSRIDYSAVDENISTFGFELTPGEACILETKEQVDEILIQGGTVGDYLTWTGQLWAT